MSKPKKTRGIFGVAKPARPMLFTFKPKDEAAWSSEDSDSDFIPSSDSQEPAKTSIRKKKTKSRKKKYTTGKASTRQSQSTDSESSHDTSGIEVQSKKKNKRTKNVVNKTQTFAKDSGPPETVRSHSDSGGEMWSVRIPLIVLEKIFEFAIKETGAVPMLCRFSRVCHLWRQAAGQPMLWQHVDLANGRVKMNDNTVQYLAATRLTRLRDINFSGWTKLTDKGLQPLSEHCPHLESINLTKCTGLSSDGVKLLVEKCHRLSAIDLSMLNSNVIVSPLALKDLLEHLKDRLEHLILQQNMLRGCPVIMKAISTHCKHLKTLDLSNCTFSTDFLGLPIEELQSGCPELQVFRLGGCKVRAQQVTCTAKVESPGFVNLSELSLAVSTDTSLNAGIGITDQFLTRIMKNARQLKLLNLRGLTHISTKGVERRKRKRKKVKQTLAVEHLEELYISQCSLSKYEGIELVVQKWRHSLVELDLSWNVFPAMSLDVAMKKLSSGPPSQSVLQHLNLSGTSITADRVRSILQGCPNLVSLNLTSCRGLPRGMKRRHGKHDLQQLSQHLGVTSSE